ncbi:VWA domain-containing protein [Luteitalea sp.]|uniref:VWA domain-containing protein n=1 Tax=Luteitalea sp. TaxID=2004800 RepID=UPI0025C2DFF4|nr:VWA domain-containing protein [Luteitalea sp.]
MGSIRAAIALAFVTASLMQLLASRAQDGQSPTFRTSTTLIEVSAIVTHKGITVADLSRDDVEVLDNGTPQPLVAFEFVNLEAVRGPQQRRDFVLILDDLQIGGSRTKASIDLATSLINALGEHDRLAILNTSPFELVQQLSVDRRSALSLVRRMRGLKGAGSVSFTQNETSRVLLEVISKVSRVFVAHGQAAERRTVLVISEGGSLGPVSPEGRPPPEEQALLDDYRRTMGDASLANVAVYCVDPRGLEAPMPEVKGSNDFDVAMASSVLGRTAGDAMVLKRFGLLRQVADATGGTLVDERNELSAGLAGMIRDSRQYYRLAYAMPGSSLETVSKPRTIEVRVKRPDTVVRHRRTYSVSSR